MEKNKRKNSAPLAFLTFPEFYQFKTELSLDECKTRLSEVIPIKRLYIGSGEMKIITAIDSTNDRYCEFLSLMGAPQVPFFLGEGSLTGQDNGTSVYLNITIEPTIYRVFFMTGLLIPCLILFGVFSPRYLSWFIGGSAIFFVFWVIAFAAGLYVRLQYRRRFAEMLAEHLNATIQ